VQKIIIRQATVTDAPAISAVHCSTVAGWYALDANGVERPARYNDLTPAQRWLNGGPWMDVETCAHHLRRLIAGGGQALAAELTGRIVAEAELHTADEPAPFGRNLNLSVLYAHRNHQGQGLGSPLMQRALELADEQNCDTFTVACAEAPDFYAKHGLRHAATYTRFQLSAQAANIDYIVEPLPDAPYDLVRGWSLMKGYYKLPEQTAKAIDGKGWLHSGDLGVMDQDGRLRFITRIKDVFRVGGENVAPPEVEEVLHQHPAIKQAQVIGVPDPRLIEVPAAYVILKPGVAATPEEIMAWSRDRMAGFRVPRYVRIVDSFDHIGMTGSAKVQKNKLRAQALIDFGLKDPAKAA